MPNIVYPNRTAQGSIYNKAHNIYLSGVNGASEFTIITGSSTPYVISYNAENLYKNYSSLICFVTSGSNSLQRTASLTLPTASSYISVGERHFPGTTVIRNDLDSTTQLKLSSSTGQYWFVTGGMPNDQILDPTNKSQFFIMPSSSIAEMIYFDFFDTSGGTNYWLVLSVNKIGSL